MVRDVEGRQRCLCDRYIMVPVGLEESMVGGAAEYMRVFEEYLIGGRRYTMTGTGRIRNGWK